jgi:predicted metal-dependent hydrolase
MVSGESHYFLGRRYRLRVIEHDGSARVVLRSQTRLELRVRPNTDAWQRERILHQWYRRQIKQLIPPLIEKWQAVMGVAVADWGVKKMKTKWGACNIEARRIWLNLELAKKSPQCLEYIIVHELAHLLERNHNDHFAAVMYKHLPHWQASRAVLNSEPLSHESWRY